MFGVEYDDINVGVHGGLTYSRMEGDLWFIGFDCAHGSDYTPGYSLGRRDTPAYKDVAYVKAQIQGLLHQVFSPLELLASTAERKKK